MSEPSISLPKFTYEDICYSTDEAMFKRAVELFKRKKVRDVIEHSRGYDGVVEGSDNYRVSVSSKNITTAYCDCYMGQNNEICKHVLALGLSVLYQIGAIDKDAKQLNKTIISDFKSLDLELKRGLRYIKYYDGPSSTWFEYQMKLEVGAGILRNAVEQAPKSVESAKILWKMVMKLSNKLSQGVDDSNGIVWPVCDLAVEKLTSWKDDEMIRPCLEKFAKDKTGFDFEEPLLNI